MTKNGKTLVDTRHNGFVARTRAVVIGSAGMEARVASPVLSKFVAAVASLYGARVERVLLYGSRARGDARPDSDYDIAVFLRDLDDRADAMYRLADIGTDILYETGEVIHAMPYQAGAYRDRTPLMHEIRADGIDL